MRLKQVHLGGGGGKKIQKKRNRMLLHMQPIRQEFSCRVKSKSHKKESRKRNLHLLKKVKTV
jgi:hypothetical protein